MLSYGHGNRTISKRPNHSNAQRSHRNKRHTIENIHQTQSIRVIKMKVEIHDDDLRKEMRALLVGEIKSIARSTIDDAVSSELDRRIKFKSEREFDEYIDRLLHDCIDGRLKRSYVYNDDTIVKVCKEMIAQEMTKIDIKDMLEKAITKRLESCQLKVHI